MKLVLLMVMLVIRLVQPLAMYWRLVSVMQLAKACRQFCWNVGERDGMLAMLLAIRKDHLLAMCEC